MPQIERAVLESTPVPPPTPGAGCSAETGLLQLEWEVRDHFAMLTVAGELDLVTAPYLQDALEHLVRDSSARLVIDLSEVPFMDCSGLNALVAARRRMSTRGWLGVVCDEQGIPWRVLDVTGTRQAIALFTSLLAAVASACQPETSANR